MEKLKTYYRSNLNKRNEGKNRPSEALFVGKRDFFRSWRRSRYYLPSSASFSGEIKMVNETERYFVRNREAFSSSISILVRLTVSMSLSISISLWNQKVSKHNLSLYFLCLSVYRSTSFSVSFSVCLILSLFHRLSLSLLLSLCPHRLSLFLFLCIFYFYPFFLLFIMRGF